jgi:hypothetical protein
MYAQVGDRLVLSGDHERAGLIINVPHADGTPPYVVKWLATGHIAMVMPGEFARIVQATRDAGARPPGHSDAAWSGTKV